MTQDMVTIELARLFESQGHYRDALDIYKALNEEGASNQIQAGIDRMEMKLAMAPDTGQGESEKKIAALLEKWLDLIVLQHRLARFKQVKSRLI